MAEITKLWIADKMKDLMKQKPIDKIRVTEICKAAEIERPTFYYHFKDKYDLVAWIFFQSAKKCKESLRHIGDTKRVIHKYRCFLSGYPKNAFFCSFSGKRQIRPQSL